MAASNAAWIAEMQLGVHIQHAVAELVRMEPRPENPVAELGRILLRRAEGGDGSSKPKVEAHEKSDVNDNMMALRACAADISAKMGCSFHAASAAHNV